MDRKAQYCSYVSASQLDLWFQCNPNKNSSKFFYRSQQTDSKTYMESQRPRIANTILKNKVVGLTLPSFKTYFKATVIKTAWYRRNNRQIDE